jgi:Rhodopirellula transposase DDE domain
VAVSREHRRAKTDPLDTELLKRAFLGWLRGERYHCKMVAIPRIEDEDAKRPKRERESLIGEQMLNLRPNCECCDKLGLIDRSIPTADASTVAFIASLVRRGIGRLVVRREAGGPLIWVSKSMEKLATTLTQMGHPISADTVRTELVKLGFSRQSNRKADEGLKRPDRNAQFEYINSKVIAAQAQRQPVISVDTKKKELVGNFKNGGTDYRPKGDPQRVNVHDFENKKLGKVVPYGVYDVTANTGFISVGITSDTAEFAVQSIRRWLERMGRQRYPNARELTVTADCGGSNGARVRLWKLELQKLADETGLVIRFHHYPPGTSKWNKIEHRLFCHITQNWRGRPLTDRLAVVELIGATTTKTGLKVESALDTRSYQKGIKVSKAQ